MTTSPIITEIETPLIINPDRFAEQLPGPRFHGPKQPLSARRRVTRTKNSIPMCQGCLSGHHLGCKDPDCPCICSDD
jgi:hypothetical protein